MRGGCIVIPFGLTPFRFYAYIGIAVAFAAVLTFGGCEHMNASDLRADKKVLEGSVMTLEDSNKSNLVTIAGLKTSVKVWKDLATPSDVMKAAAARAAELELQNQKLNEELAHREEKDDGKPDCVKLLDTDFELVCREYASGMRERAGRKVDGAR